VLFQMNKDLFYFFKELFEMINVSTSEEKENGGSESCIHYFTHKLGKIMRVRSFFDLKAVNVFWGIFNYSTNAEVVKIASEIFVDLHIYIDNQKVDGQKFQAWFLFYEACKEGIKNKNRKRCLKYLHILVLFLKK
jgi:hypothetical protein